MGKPLKENCLDITQPIILHPFRSSLYWKKTLKEAAENRNRKTKNYVGIETCSINRCIDFGFIHLMQQDGKMANMAWEKIYKLYLKNLTATAIACGCKEPALVEDLIQEVFANFIENIKNEGFQLNTASLKTYLCTAVYYQWVSYTRAKIYTTQVGNTPIDPEKGEGTSTDPPDTNPSKPIGEVFEKMRRLIALNRKIFPDPNNNCFKLLKYVILHGMKYKEILKTPEGQKYSSVEALANRISHCWKVIRKGNWGDDFDDIVGDNE